MGREGFSTMRPRLEIAGPAGSLTLSAGETRRDSSARRRSAAKPVVVAAGAALGACVALALVGGLDVSAQTANLARGSAGTVLAALAAYLFLGRMRRSGALIDIALTASLTLLALRNLVLVLFASSNAEHGDLPVQAIISGGAGPVIAAGFVLAAFAPSVPLEDAGRRAERLVGYGIAVALVAIAAIALGVQVLPGTGALTAAELTTGVLWAAAAVGFVRLSGDAERMTFTWLAAASAVKAVGWGAFAVVGSVNEASSGDLLQVIAGFAVLVAALRTVESDHERRALMAVEHERRRLARDLHDGLAQELAYITTESRRLASNGAPTHLVEAAERALEESRSAILQLSRPTNETLDRVISDTAESIGARGGVDVTVAVRPGLEASPERRQALLRILREAMTNAIRHGRAAHIRISVDGPSPLVMVVADDGAGFDLRGDRRPDSLGLQSMAERAENLGGRMTLETRIGCGTSVAVVLP